MLFILAFSSNIIQQNSHKIVKGGLWIVTAKEMVELFIKVPKKCYKNY